jgi:hypothetical protein
MLDAYSQSKAVIQRELAAGESLLWSGRPDPVRSSRAAYGCWVFAVPWTAFSVFWMLMASGVLSGKLNLPFALFGLPFVLVGLGMLMAPRWAYASAKKTVYAVTNQRLIVMTEGRFRSVKSFYADDIGSLERRERPDGTGDLIFAKRAWRDSDGDRRYSETGFTGIRDVRSVEQLVYETFKSEKK